MSVFDIKYLILLYNIFGACPRGRAAAPPKLPPGGRFCRAVYAPLTIKERS
jgi:hypothetical protein